MRSIFISYVFEDKETLNTIKNWKNQGLSPNIDFVSEQEDLRQKGESEVKKYLSGLIDKSDGIVILVGDDTHSKLWIKWEYSYAQNKKKKVAVFRIPNSKGAVPDLVPIKEPIKLSLLNLNKELNNWGWL